MQIDQVKPCLICEESCLHNVEGFTSLPRITSDCRPYVAGGQLFICGKCDSIQKNPNDRWLEEISQIYSDYSAYSLAGGEEQLVLDAETGQPQKRSEVIMRQLQRTGLLPKYGNLIDVGCGHGVTLKAMSVMFPNWKLFGHELGDGSEIELHAIRGFQRLYKGNLDQINEKFDFISMIHSLEHFVDPLATLKTLRDKLKNGSYLFVQVPNVEENYFDLLVADHLTHFSTTTLEELVKRAGFQIIKISTDWIKKELSLLAFKSLEKDSIETIDASKIKKDTVTVQEKLNWLKKLIIQAEESALIGVSFGLFGTSIASTWLASVLSDRVEFFVDEDPNRIGKFYMGRQVLAPSDVPSKATVFIPLAYTLAISIKERLKGLNIKIILPE